MNKIVDKASTPVLLILIVVGLAGLFYMMVSLDFFPDEHKDIHPNTCCEACGSDKATYTITCNTTDEKGKEVVTYKYRVCDRCRKAFVCASQDDWALRIATQPRTDSLTNIVVPVFCDRYAYYEGMTRVQALQEEICTLQEKIYYIEQNKYDGAE